MDGVRKRGRGFLETLFSFSVIARSLSRCRLFRQVGENFMRRTGPSGSPDGWAAFEMDAPVEYSDVFWHPTSILVSRPMIDRFACAAEKNFGQFC